MNDIEHPLQMSGVRHFSETSQQISHAQRLVSPWGIAGLDFFSLSGVNTAE